MHSTLDVMENVSVCQYQSCVIAWCGLGAVTMSVCMLLWRIVFLPSSVMCYSMVWAGCSHDVSVHAVMENCVFAIISHVL